MWLLPARRPAAPPITATPARLPLQAVDACCASKNPWTDRSCRAWTTRGSCAAVVRTWQPSCCAQKWSGEDWWCDSQAYGSSCSSWGPARDACCAGKDPWTDSAYKAWLPSGDCSSVSSYYQDACCQNKPLGKQGCPGPVVGDTCGSLGPNGRDA